MLAATPGRSHVHANMSSQHQSVPSPLTCALLGLLCPHAQRDNRGGAWTSGRYDELRKQVEIARAELAVSHHIVDTVPPVIVGFPDCQSLNGAYGLIIGFPALPCTESAMHTGQAVGREPALCCSLPMMLAKAAPWNHYNALHIN